MSSQDHANPSSPVQPSPPPSSTPDPGEIPLDDLEKVTGGVSVPGLTPSPTPGPRHHAE